MWRILSKLIGGGVLDRVLDTVDKRVEAQTDKDRIKGEILQEHIRSRPGYMQAGGFVLMLLFAIPLGGYFAAVIVYSVLWCAGCAFPQDWTIAALPPPLDEWSWLIVVSIFGVVGVTGLKR